MPASPSSFWSDLVEDLEDPEFRVEYILKTIRVATIDSVIAQIDEAREAAGFSKAALARAMGAEPVTLRRLLSAGQVNPTLGTLSEVASALGMQITVTPLPDDERQSLAEALLCGDGHSDALI